MSREEIGATATLKVLVTGGRGRLARALAQVGGSKVQAPWSTELDITDDAAFRSALERWRPNAVINAAALSSVEASDTAPERARAVNATAPGQMALACDERRIPLIHISTDYVFGAPTLRPWRESDTVSPINSYGRLKAEGELNVIAAGKNVCVVRVAWLFGDREDFIAHLLRAGTGVARVAHDQIGSPTPIFPLAERILRLAARMSGTDSVPTILHLAGSPPVSRADWVASAFEALQRSGTKTPRLERVPMAEFPSLAPRPKYSALDCSLATELFGEELDWRMPMALPQAFAD